MKLQNLRTYVLHLLHIISIVRLNARLPRKWHKQPHTSLSMLPNAPFALLALRTPHSKLHRLVLTAADPVFRAGRNGFAYRPNWMLKVYGALWHVRAMGAHICHRLDRHVGCTRRRRCC